MKHIFKITTYSLFISLALGTTNTFGMKSLFEESKEQEFYTPGTQQHAMPSASSTLTPQATAGLTLSQAPWQNMQAEEHKVEVKERTIAKDHSNEPRFKLLYDILTTMPPELINTILDYAKEFEGKHVRTIETSKCELYTLTEVSLGIIACFAIDGLTFWNIETGQHIKTIKPFTIYKGNQMLPLTKDILALGLSDGTIKLLNWKTETVQETNNTHKKYVVALSKLSDQLFASTDSHEMKLWKSETGQLIKTIDIEPEWGYVVQLVALTQNIVAAVTNKGGIKIWNTETGQCSPNILYTPSIHESGEPYLIMISPKVLAATASRKKEIYLWNWETGQQLGAIKTTDSLSSLASSSNNLLAAGLNNGNIELYDPETGKCENSFKAHKLSTRTLIALSKNQFASAQRDSKEIKIWE